MKDKSLTSNRAPLKVLLISHVPIDSVYGTATSLRSHFEALEQTGQYEFQLICQKPIFHGDRIKISNNDIKKTWPSIKNIKSVITPYRFNYDGVSQRVDHTFRTRLHRIISLMRWNMLTNTINQFNPQIIHLSSLVLAPLASWFKHHMDMPTIPIVGHVRELLRKPLSVNEIHEIEFLDMLICIDSAAKSRLLDVMTGAIGDDRVAVVQNPFRSSLASPDPDLFEGIDLNSTTVFAIVGEVSRDKGVKKVCEDFLKANLSGSVLLVVGEGKDTKYVEEVEKLCNNNRGKLLWIGQHPNLIDRGFFNGVDVIVRGDATFRTGRTVYEALFSGANVLLPGDKTDLDNDPSLAVFRNQVFLYKSMDSPSLIYAYKCFATQFPKMFSARVKPSKTKNNFDSYSR
ncbi:MAG: hypothetical protein P4M12_00390, partial [Gammaproteobacteria bacterium]|nr:hypothetical protein [Gammaproteobacteria bacterium]